MFELYPACLENMRYDVSIDLQKTSDEGFYEAALKLCDQKAVLTIRIEISRS